MEDRIYAAIMAEFGDVPNAETKGREAARVIAEFVYESISEAASDAIREYDEHNF